MDISVKITTAMQINQAFWEAMKPILCELKNDIGGDFVVFGSAPLYLWGVLEFEGGEKLNDLDVAVGNVFVPRASMREVFFHDDPKQKLYKLSIRGINVDVGSAWPGWEEIYEKIFNSALEVEGVKFASLAVVREWKEMMVRKYGREKDEKHLERIKEYGKRKAEVVRVRSAKVEDVADILRLKDNVWVATYTSRELGITAEDIRGREGGNPERMIKMQSAMRDEKNASRAWVAQDGAETIGMISAEKGEERNHLSSLYLDLSYQRMGIGRRLWEQAFAWLGNGKDIHLGVVEYNTGAIEFYRKAGFEIAGKLQDHVLPGGKKMPVLEMIRPSPLIKR